jgi:hypothetical protein
LQDELKDLRELEEDWDGYGGLPPSRESVATVAIIIEWLDRFASFEVPEIGPHSNGTIGLTWEAPGREAYLEVGKTRYTGYLSGVGLEVRHFGGTTTQLAPDLLASVTDHVRRAEQRQRALSSVF